MSEGNVFGQPGKSDKLLDDLARTQPDWSKPNVDDRPVVRVPPSFTDDDPKIGGAEKSGNEPMCGLPDPHADAKREYDRLMAVREELILDGVPEADLVMPLLPRTTVRIKPKDQGPVEGYGAAYEAERKRNNPLYKVEPTLYSANVGQVPPLPGNPLYGEGVTREKIDALPREQVEALAKPLVDYVWDGARGSKDSNPKEAFGSRKAGLSTISKPVLYEVGLAMLEGALKYGRHNYRIAGVRASTYYDACGRHMDAWWEGQDIDPDSGAQLHHVTKAIAGLTVIRDSMIVGNWTDDRPPSIADPNWLAWYNKQAEILVDACKNPKPPYVKGDTE